MSIENNKKVARSVIEAIDRADWQFVIDVFAEEAVIWVSGTLPMLSGTHDKDFVRGLKEGNPQQFPNGMRFTVKALTAEGDRVAVEAETLGEHANGKTYNNHFHLLMVIRDGLVYEWKEYMDTMHANEVLLDGAAG